MDIIGAKVGDEIVSAGDVEEDRKPAAAATEENRHNVSNSRASRTAAAATEVVPPGSVIVLAKASDRDDAKEERAILFFPDNLQDYLWLLNDDEVHVQWLSTREVVEIPKRRTRLPAAAASGSTTAAAAPIVSGSGIASFTASTANTAAAASSAPAPTAVSSSATTQSTACPVHANASAAASSSLQAPSTSSASSTSSGNDRAQLKVPTGYRPVKSIDVKMLQRVLLADGNFTDKLRFLPGNPDERLPKFVPLGHVSQQQFEDAKQQAVGELGDLFKSGGVSEYLGLGIRDYFREEIQGARPGQFSNLGLLLCPAKSGISAALEGTWPPNVDPLKSPTFDVAVSVKQEAEKSGINFDWINLRHPKCTCDGCVAITDEEAAKIAPLIHVLAKFYRAIGGGLRLLGAAGTSRGVEHVVKRLDPNMFAVLIPIANHLSLVTYYRPAGTRNTFAIRSADLSSCYFTWCRLSGVPRLFKFLVDHPRCVMICDDFSKYADFDFEDRTTLPPGVAANSSPLARKFVTCVSNATARGLQVMNGEVDLPENMCAEEAATSCGKPPQPVIAFETTLTMQALNLTSTNAILNQSPRRLCASVPALKVCTAKTYRMDPDSVISTFGGDNNTLVNVTLTSGPVFFGRRHAITLVRYNPSGFGGSRFKTPLMGDINTNGNDLVHLGPSGQVTRIEAFKYWMENMNALFVCDASGDGDSLIKILRNQEEGLDFFPSANGRNLRDGFSLDEVYASMPAGLNVGGADDLWLVKGLPMGQHMNDVTVVDDADARIAAIRNRHEMMLNVNAPATSSRGKECIVSENGVDIALFSSLSRAMGEPRCANYADYGVATNCVVPGQLKCPKYTRPRLLAAADPSRGLQSSKYPGRYLRLRRYINGSLEETIAQDPFDPEV